MGKQKILAGAGVLAAAGILAKILSALYRVPFQNLVGDAGFYVYQQVYPIYGIGMVMALSGWPLFISKVIAEQPNDTARKHVAWRLFWLLTGLSIVVFSGLFFGAPLIAEGMGNDLRLIPEIQAISWLFLVMPFLAVGRGYTQGMVDMAPTAISQVLEQLVRVALIIGIAWVSVENGWSVYKIGTWAMFAATVAGLVAAMYLAWYVRQLPREKEICDTSDLGWKTLGGRLWREGGILAVVAALLVLLQLIDSFTITTLLQDFGQSMPTAAIEKGIYDRGQPLLQLGMVIATGLGTTLIPVMRDKWFKQDQEGLRHDFQLTMRLALVSSTLVTVGLIAIMPSLNQLLFETSSGSTTLQWYVLTIVPATLIVVMISILQSVDQSHGIAKWLLMTLLFKYLGNQLFIPSSGTAGAAISTAFSLVPLAIVVLRRVPKAWWQGMDWSRWTRHLLCLVMVVGFSALLMRGFLQSLGLDSRSMSIVVTMISILTGLGAAFFGMRRWAVFTPTDWKYIPKGDKIQKKIYR